MCHARHFPQAGRGLLRAGESRQGQIQRRGLERTLPTFFLQPMIASFAALAVVATGLGPERSSEIVIQSQLRSFGGTLSRNRAPHLPHWKPQSLSPCHDPPQRNRLRNSGRKHGRNHRPHRHRWQGAMEIDSEPRGRRGGLMSTNPPREWRHPWHETRLAFC